MAQETGKLKVKKKRWYPLLPPVFLNQRPVAELMSEDISTLVGKKMTINLMQITKDFRHQDSSVLIKISGTSGQQLKSDFVKFETSLNSIKRNVRRRRDRIDVRVIFKTKDDVTAFIKIVMVTSRNTPRMIRTKARKAVEKFILKIGKTRTFIDIAGDIVKNKLQKEIPPEVKSIYPIKNINVREYGLYSGELKPQELIEEPKETSEEKKEKEGKKEKREETKVEDTKEESKTETKKEEKPKAEKAKPEKTPEPKKEKEE
jgi:ribosomal protein S3AE